MTTYTIVIDGEIVRGDLNTTMVTEPANAQAPNATVFTLAALNADLKSKGYDLVLGSRPFFHEATANDASGSALPDGISLAFATDDPTQTRLTMSWSDDDGVAPTSGTFTNLSVRDLNAAINLHCPRLVSGYVQSDAILESLGSLVISAIPASIPVNIVITVLSGSVTLLGSGNDITTLTQSVYKSVSDASFVPTDLTTTINPLQLTILKTSANSVYIPMRLPFAITDDLNAMVRSPCYWTRSSGVSRLARLVPDMLPDFTPKTNADTLRTPIATINLTADTVGSDYTLSTTPALTFDSVSEIEPRIPIGVVAFTSDVARNIELYGYGFELMYAQGLGINAPFGAMASSLLARDSTGWPGTVANAANPGISDEILYPISSIGDIVSAPRTWLYHHSFMINPGDIVFVSFSNTGVAPGAMVSNPSNPGSGNQIAEIPYGDLRQLLPVTFGYKATAV